MFQLSDFLDHRSSVVSLKGQGHVGACPRERERDCPADPNSRAGDESGFPCEVDHSRDTRWVRASLGEILLQASMKALEVDV
jgi:hypothetical protein